jgi:hypothetical protein
MVFVGEHTVFWFGIFVRNFYLAKPEIDSGLDIFVSIRFRAKYVLQS